MSISTRVIIAIAHGNEEVKGIVGVAHNDEQGGLTITQGVQLQLIIGGQITQLLDVEGCQPCAAGNEDGFCRFASDVLSRTF